MSESRSTIRKIEKENGLQKTQEDQQNKKGVIREYAEAIIVALVLALFIRTFIVQAFKIPSGSMIPTLHIGDHILVNKFIYWFTKPKRGDLLVFKYPVNPSRDFIKRVIGLPGDTVEVKHRKVYINGKLLNEEYPIFTDKGGMEMFKRDNFNAIKVPAHNYFMMGDNRDNSLDSRFWGTLDEDLIEGKAFLIYWSIEPSENIFNVDSPISSSLQYLAGITKRIQWSRTFNILH